MATKIKSKGNIVRVVGSEKLKEEMSYLESQGYAVLRPGGIKSNDAADETWHDFFSNQMTAGVGGGKSGRKSVPTLFASSGSEQVVSEDVGTKGLGWMEWGVGNRLPNVVSLLCSLHSGWIEIQHRPLCRSWS